MLLNKEIFKRIIIMLQLKGSIGKPNYQVIALLAAAGVAPLRVFTGLTAQAELLALVDVVASPVVGGEHKTVTKQRSINVSFPKLEQFSRRRNLLRPIQ